MSAGTITDPDLMQAIEDLKYQARRLEQIDSLINDLDEVEGYSRIMAMRAERAELREQLRIRAEKLNVPPRSLYLLVSTANRLRTPRTNQLPTLKIVRNHIEIARDAAEREHLEADAEAKIARVVARGAGLRAKAGTDALAYLDASAS